MEEVVDPYKRLLQTYHELNPSFIEYSFGPPTPLQFAQHVRQNRPVVFRDALYDADGEEWEARAKWTKEYLLEKMKGRKISVAETPWGNADSVIQHAGQDVFVKPHTTSQPFDFFLSDVITGSRLSSSDLDGIKTIKYAQSQDDNLHGEFEPFLEDVPKNLTWAAPVFGDQEPDAMNLWIGNQNSVSALHKDNYENLYCLIKGSKTFILVSPLEVGCLRERTLPSATYKPNVEGKLEVAPDIGDDGVQEVVHCWPTVDPENPGKDVPDLWREGRVYEVTVTEGDVLYLPAMWYHKVKQECGEDGYCVAVNYWYDMEFSGPFYSLVDFVRNVNALREKEVEAKEKEKDQIQK